HPGAERARDGMHAVMARPADELQRIRIVEVVLLLLQRARSTHVGPPAVVADQLHQPLASTLRINPQRMWCASVRAALDALDELILWALLPLDAARLHPERERGQGFILQAVPIEIRVAGRRERHLATYIDRRPAPCPQDCIHAVDMRQSFRLLSASVGER